MECNKDEAVRAKEIAEQKMQSNDFEAARKIAVRAKNLYPELENIAQLLCICDVHCSAQKGLVGFEKDWYGILQIEKLADELTIKKQYRRLALILHPDKNRFPGAESAFKLICEANALLTDPTRKSIYDNKITVLGRCAPSNNGKQQNPQLNKQSGSTQPNSTSAVKEVFWTSCPFCRTRYQYLRQFVKKSLSCPTCRKIFVAYEVNVQGNSSRTKSDQPQASPPKPDSSQPADFQEKKSPKKDNCKTGVQNDKNGHPTSKKTFRPEPDVRVGVGSKGVEKEIENSRTEVKNNARTDSLLSEKEGGTSKRDANRRETRDTRNKSRKWVKNESSESINTLSDDVSDSMLETSRVVRPRKSSRKRQHVLYDEAEVGNLASNLNRPKDVNLDEQKDALDSEDLQNGCENRFPTDPEENLKAREHHDKSDEKNKVGGEIGGKSCNGFDAVEIESDPEEDIFFSDNSGIECPDPEFSDFEKARDEAQFDVNQFWACYDNILDCMPRFYAKIKKVSSSPFELTITWLEAVPIDEAYEKWVDEELPVGCGSFKLGKTEKSQARLSFSHQVHFEKGKKRGSLFMYPREGEVWALFKDWDISWSFEPDNHRLKFNYEIVEVVSDFVPGFGIRAVYLDKIIGFVSLFERACENEPFVIRPGEIYKFSHCVPCFKITGSEKGAPPTGCFELDPACLPLNPDELYYPAKAKMKDRKNEGTSGAPKKTVDLESGGVGRDKTGDF